MSATPLIKPDFLSPSTVNSFIAYRHQWYAQKVLGRGFTSTHYFERGKAVEEGVRMVLEGSSLDEAVTAANAMLKEGMKDLPEEDRNECMEYVLMMRKYIEVGSNQLKKYGKLNDRNHPNWTKRGVRVEFKHPIVPVPFYGFLDFLFDDVCADLKVKKKKPSTLDASYIQQGLIYQWATKVPVVFENIVHTSKGTDVYPLWLNKVPSLDWHEKNLVAAANSLLAVYDAVYSGDIDKLLHAMSYPNLSGVWNKNEKVELFEEFVLKSPFVTWNQEVKRNPLTGDPVAEVKPTEKQESKEDVVKSVLSNKEEVKETEEEKPKKKCPL